MGVRQGRLTLVSQNSSLYIRCSVVKPRKGTANRFLMIEIWYQYPHYWLYMGGWVWYYHLCSVRTHHSVLIFSSCMMSSVILIAILPPINPFEIAWVPLLTWIMDVITFPCWNNVKPYLKQGPTHCTEQWADQDEKVHLWTSYTRNWRSDDILDGGKWEHISVHCQLGNPSYERFAHGSEISSWFGIPESQRHLSVNHNCVQRANHSAMTHLSKWIS